MQVSETYNSILSPMGAAALELAAAGADTARGSAGKDPTA